MQNAKITPTPLPQGYYPSKHLGLVDSELQSHFQQVIGSLLYIMLGTHPDIAYAIAALSQHPANALKEHLDKALIGIASSDQVQRQQQRNEPVRENTHLVLDTLASRLRELSLNCRS